MRFTKDHCPKSCITGGEVYPIHLVNLLFYMIKKILPIRKVLSNFISLSTFRKILEFTLNMWLKFNYFGLMVMAEMPKLLSGDLLFLFVVYFQKRYFI
jgi:hypothetical protein